MVVLKVEMKAVFWQGNSERISDRNMQPMFTAMSVVRFLFLSLLYRLLYSLPAYVSIVGSRTDVQNKSRTLTKPVKHPSNLPKWNYDGLSTGQAPGEDSEVILYPQTIFKDSFHGGNNILVICDTYTPQGVYIPTNKHGKAADIFSDPKVVLQVPWFGINQEYTLTDEDMKWPLGWHVGGYPGPEL